ncbi:transcriptional regulator, DeoR family [Spirochaeta thermophila DSM 6578]|uniref:Transcriptional regulator, DeoR family n=1 Tax=Winmispira thermophila (strain ATCC 700085 / DSM 6578 / Z-1203) TaxID=869211 RepID=G0GFR9_WINT7|nr:DeoR/GlpR family DNA-binding transcription regulator [Spirochaeta thermophila]AEJ61612.1 transcriptional regulator, DeoR family [Spirochaeta thermophila DSM 6578]
MALEDLAERQQQILTLLAENGSLSVGDLARRFGVSEVTIRSDLKSLEERGLVNRTRGGATPALHRSILERMRLRTEEKHRIARAASSFVEDGMVVMIEAGTTTALIVRYLVGKRDVHIVTNSTLVFSYARLNPSLRITVVGGEFRRETESMVGPIALSTIQRLHVPLAFVGTDGFSLERGMTTHLFEGAEIVKAMRQHSVKTILVADSSKYGKVGFVHVLPLEEIDVVITDAGLPEDAREELREAGVDLIIV